MVVEILLKIVNVFFFFFKCRNEIFYKSVIGVKIELAHIKVTCDAALNLELVLSLIKAGGKIYK